ncbi:putative proteasome inhibitor isoform X2 [Bidens hawaiensis]|uniref:putative proteasome inhibitor isoform X2 n=1 Tax=Bidens hawaiensis TaxID=980011 RepID=UPI0040498474
MATEQSVLALIRASRPNFKNSADKIAFAIHSIFVAAGFNFNATGPPAFSDDALSTPFSDEAGIEGWNEVEDTYAFVYSIPNDSSKKVLVKCLVMNNQLLIDALASGKSNPVHLKINIDDFAVASADTKYSSQYKNLGKLIDLVNKDVLAKLYGSSAAASSSKAPSSERDTEYGGRDQPTLFGYEDPYSHFPPGGGFGDGGMLVGPSDPRFFGGGGRMGFPGAQPGVPPGARYDPFGPPDVPGFEPNRFARNPRGPPGGAHPDLQHFHNDADFI